MPMRFKTTEEDRNEMRSAGNASSIGLFFGIAIAIGYFGGAWLDKHFHIDPWGSMVGALLGIAAGFLNLIQVASQLSKDEDELDKRNKGG